jgi:hypothetical protein
MEMLFSDWAATTGLAGMAGNVDLRLTLLVRCPFFYGPDSPDPAHLDDFTHITSCDTMRELFANPMWQTVSPEQNFDDPIHSITTCNFNVVDTVVTVTGTWTYVSDEDALIFGWVLTVPSVSAESSPLDEEIVCVARYNRLVFITGTDGPPRRGTEFTYDIDSDSRKYLFSYDLTDIDADTGRLHAWVGSPVLKIPPMKWESARAVHVWLDPTRTNYISNPSFRTSSRGRVGWRTNARGGWRSIPGGRLRGITTDLWCGQAGFLYTDPDLVLESIPFPTQNREGWTSQISVWIDIPDVEVRAGILLLPDNGNIAPENLLYLHSGWRKISAQSWASVRAALPQVDGFKEGVFRMEAHLPEGAQAAEVRFDDAIVEPNISNKGFFDGGFGMGFTSDFNWVNGPESENASFSTFYNNRKVVNEFLFGTWINSRDPITFEEETIWSRGMVEEWVPEGVKVIGHWDDVSLKRTHSWMQDVHLPAYDYPDKSVVFELAP